MDSSQEIPIKQKSTQTMAIFVAVKTHLNVLGFNRSENNHITSTDWFRRAIFFTIILILDLSLFWYLAFEATTFTEYTDSMFVLFSGVTIILMIPVVLWRIDRFEDLFDQFHAKIEEREYNKLKSQY